MEYQKLINLLGKQQILQNYQYMLLKNGLKFMMNQMKHTMLAKISGLTYHN